MLLGEHQPLPCSMCLGRGEMPSFFGKRRCVQCDGIGLEAIPDKTCEALGIVWDNYRQVRRKK